MTARDLRQRSADRPPAASTAAARELVGDPSRRLSDVLRDELGLTGTKIGCHAGDCGACTVLLDGEQVCACIVAVGQCDGRAVTTVEGLAGAGRRALARCSGPSSRTAPRSAASARPGMLMSAEALLRANPQPTEAEVRDALAGVLCRCTGYRKIVEAVLAAAGGRRSSMPAPVRRERRVASARRVAAARRAGQGAPATSASAPTAWPGDPAGRAGDARRPLAASRMRAFDARRPRRARARAGRASSTCSPPPTCRTTRFAIFPDLRDQPVLADGVARFRGEAVLALVGDAETLLALAEAELPIRYAPLPAHETPTPRCAAGRGRRGAACALSRQRALPRPRRRAATSTPRSPTRRSARARERDLRDALRRARLHRARGRLRRDRRGATAPARRCAGSASSPARRRPTWTATRSRSVLAIAPRAGAHRALGDRRRLRRQARPLGAAAARGRRLEARPRRCAWSTSGRSRCSRAPSAIRRRCGDAPPATPTARLVAFDFSGDFNTGAYSSWGPTVANRVPIHASGPYRVPHVRALTRAVLTNNSVAGAFRGFGVPQAALLGELLIDELAAQLRHRRARVPPSQRAARRRHARRPGSGSGASVGLRRSASTRCGPAWRDARRRAAERDAVQRRRRPSRRAACTPLAPRRRHRLHVVRHRQHRDRQSVDDARRAALRRRRAAPHLFLYNGAQEIGQGTATIMPQMFADARRPAAGVRRAGDGRHRPDRRRRQVVGVAPDLRLRQRGASRPGRRCAGSCSSGSAAPRVPPTTPTLVLDATASLWSARAGGRRPPSQLDLARRSAAPTSPATGDLCVGSGHFNPPTVPLDADGQGVPYATYGFAAQIAEVEVDIELGTVKLLHIHAAHDVGRAINPTLVEGQIHGGIAQGIGMALMEEYVNGRTDNLHDYLIPTVGDVPPITRAPDRGSGAARAVGRQGRRRAGAGRDGAGDPQRDPRGHRRAHARGAGDAEPRCARRSARRSQREPAARGRERRSAHRTASRADPIPARQAGASTDGRRARRSCSSTRARPSGWPPTRCAATPARCCARSARASSAPATATATSTAC